MATAITQVLQELAIIAAVLKGRIDKHQVAGRTLTLKLKFADYQQITRSKTLFSPVCDLETIVSIGKSLLSTVALEQKVRLLGLTLSNLDDEEFVQLSLPGVVPGLL